VDRRFLRRGASTVDAHVGCDQVGLLDTVDTFVWGDQPAGSRLSDSVVGPRIVLVGPLGVLPGTDLGFFLG
jgi:hypothetical protein